MLVSNLLKVWQNPMMISELFIHVWSAKWKIFSPVVTRILFLHLEKKLVKHTKWLRPDWKWWVGMTEQDPGLLGILFWWAEAYFLPTAVTWLCINLLTRTFYTPGTIPGSVDIFTSEKVHKIIKTLLWHFYQFNGKGQPTNFLIIEHILDYIKAMILYLYIYQYILLTEESNICSQETFIVEVIFEWGPSTWSN